MARKQDTLPHIFPRVEDFLELEPEDIAPLLLQILNQMDSRKLSRFHFIHRTGELGRYAGNQYDEVAKAVTEAWTLLEREGLLAPEPDQTSELEARFITRRGKSLQSQTDFQAYRRGSLLPRESLDPTLSTKVRPLFLRGDYDTAVFRAFKEVEIRVRSAAKLTKELIGVDLMRKAFHTENGQLTDIGRSRSERQAMSDLFAGAIGLFKNPSSHRDVSYNPEIAADLIRLANYLLWLVEVRSQ